MGSSELTEVQATRVARTHPSTRYKCWVNGALTDLQKEAVGNLQSFVSGAEYDQFTLLLFSENCHMAVRHAIHPTPFIFQQRPEQFQINFNPTSEQMPGVRRFLDLVRAMAALPRLPPPNATFHEQFKMSINERL
jgi:hypothetical protein